MNNSCQVPLTCFIDFTLSSNTLLFDVVFSFVCARLIIVFHLERRFLSKPVYDKSFRTCNPIKIIQLQSL